MTDKWEPITKSGQIVPLFKKGNKNDGNNDRGICLLTMASRILAPLLTDRLKAWPETLGLLDENQNWFRTRISTADATRIITRIQVDITEDLV